MGIERLKNIVEEIIQIRAALAVTSHIEAKGPEAVVHLNVEITAADCGRRLDSVMLNRAAILHLEHDTSWVVDVAANLRERLAKLKREALECVADLLADAR